MPIHRDAIERALRELRDQDIEVEVNMDEGDLDEVGPERARDGEGFLGWSTTDGANAFEGQSLVRPLCMRWVLARPSIQIAFARQGIVVECLGDEDEEYCIPWGDADIQPEP